LAKEIMEKVVWKNCENVYNKISGFNAIWENVSEFSKLSKIVTEKYRQL
jgi:hypothetical protein